MVIPHDQFGLHLDSRGRTEDENLEKRNFEFAGNTLAKLWNDVTLDSFKLTAEYIPPKEDMRTTKEHSKNKTAPDILSAQWYAQHVRESQYLLQVNLLNFFFKTVMNCLIV